MPPSTGTIQVNYVRMGTPSHWAQMGGTQLYVDYGITNTSSDVAHEFWLDWKLVDADGKEHGLGEMLFDIPPGETVDRHCATNQQSLGIGPGTLHVRIFNETAIYYEGDLDYEIPPPPPRPPSTGTIQVNYVRVSDPSHWSRLEGTALYVDYGITNTGTEVAHGFEYIWKLVDADGKEHSLGETIYDIPPGETVDRHFATNSQLLGVGEVTLHVRIHNETVVHYEGDLTFDLPPPEPPPPSTGTLKIEYARMGNPEFQSWQTGTQLNVDYGVTNTGTEIATRWFYEWTLTDSDGKEHTLGTSIFDVPPGATEDRHFATQQYSLGLGSGVLHLRFYNEAGTIYETDLQYEIRREDPPPDPSTGSLTVNYVRMGTPADYSGMEGTQLYLDYGVSNPSDLASHGFWYEWTIVDSDGNEHTQGTMLFDIPPRATEDRHFATSTGYSLGSGPGIIHVRFYNENGTYFDDDIPYDIRRDDPNPTPAAAVIVEYVQMSDQDPYRSTPEGNQIRVVYGISNPGTATAAGLWYDWTVFAADGRELGSAGGDIEQIAPGATLDRLFETTAQDTGMGQCRIHVRIFNQIATYFDADLWFEVGDPEMAN